MADIQNKRHDFSIETVDLRDERIVCDKLRLNQVLSKFMSSARENPRFQSWDERA